MRFSRLLLIRVGPMMATFRLRNLFWLLLAGAWFFAAPLALAVADESESAETEDEAVIVRPNQPERPADPEELKLQPDGEGRIRFNFHGQPWPGVLEWIARVSHLNLDWQELPEKKASRILASRPGDFTDETQSQELVEWMVATADDFARVFPHFLGVASTIG